MQYHKIKSSSINKLEKFIIKQEVKFDPFEFIYFLFWRNLNLQSSSFDRFFLLISDFMKLRAFGAILKARTHGGTSEGQSHCMNYWRNVHEFDVHDSEMDTVLKIFLWKKNLTAPNPKIFYAYGGPILVFKGNFFQHHNLYICPPVLEPWKIVIRNGSFYGDVHNLRNAIFRY